MAFIFRNPIGSLLKSIHPFFTGRNHGNHRTVQVAGQMLDLNLNLTLLRQVHHINYNNQRHTHLEQLCGQIQPSFHITGINNIRHHIRFFTEKEIAGGHLIQRIR